MPGVAAETRTDVLLRFTGVSKSYPGVRALDGVSLEVRAGEVHALVGENGAGKSTLIGVAAGVVVAEEGTVEIGGTRLTEPSPSQAAALGLAVVYQHSSTLQDLTVFENLVLSVPPGMGGSERSGQKLGSRAWVETSLHRAGLGVHPQTRVSDLSTAQRQMLEIAKALAFDCSVLLLDEPTESLTQAESEVLFERIAQVKASGAAVVYISHRLADVRRISDRFTILRDGRTRGTFDTGEISEHDIVELMIGREAGSTFPPKATDDAAAPVVMTVEGLTGTGFADVDLEVRRGEILGFAGVEGNGQREALRGMAGLGHAAGRVVLAGVPVSVRSVSAAQKNGIYYLPGDRHAEGVFLPLSVAENVSLLQLPQLSRAGIVSNAAERSLAASVIERFNVKTPGSASLVGTLSGGNQQKVLLGRTLAPSPAVLLAEEPTRGVDVGARAEIYRQLRGYSDSGSGVVVLSSDAAELAGLCDRVIVFSRGRVVDVLEGERVSERVITGTAVTAVTEKITTGESSGSRGRAGRFLAGDYLPASILALLIVALSLGTQAINGFFLSPRSLFDLFVAASVLLLVSVGQAAVFMTRGIDLSVGPTMSVTVVTLSLFAGADQGPGSAVIGIVLVLAVGVAIGLVNAVLIRRTRLSPVLATLITSIVLQGIALLIRPEPGGPIGSSVTDLSKLGSGPMPYVFLIAVALAVLLEVALRRTRWGRELRAVGSNENSARQLGARVERSYYSAYVLAGLTAALAGVVLSSVVGIGDANVGQAFTLTSVTVVVLGGVSVLGGRGSFIGVLLAAVLIQILSKATTFLHLGAEWQYWVPGALILVAAVVFTTIRLGQGARR